MIALKRILGPHMKDQFDIPEISFKGIATDSKKVKHGDLFIAIKGEQHNGNEYIKNAIELGAAGIITEEELTKKMSIPQLRVNSSRKALSALSAAYYGNPSKKLKIIGITGTNGKTTTATLVKSILEDANIKVAQIGTLGLKAKGMEPQNTLTTPDALFLHNLFSKLLDSGFTHIVMEVSSHALDQSRVADIDFDLAVFTNISPEHLDYHKNFKSYAATKQKLFKMLGKNAISVINISEDFGVKLSNTVESSVVGFSNNNSTGIYFESIDNSINGITGIVNAKNIKYSIKSNLIGLFNSENILAAIGASQALGIEKKSIEDGIHNCSLIEGRMEIYHLKNQAKAIIDYAHTPDSYIKVMETIKNLQSYDSDLHVIFGAGGDRDKKKRAIMANIVEKYANHIYVTPDNPRYEKQCEINNQIISGFKSNRFSVYEDREKGIEEAICKAKTNDIIAVLGKGREPYQEILGKKIPHSDLEIVRRYV